MPFDLNSDAVIKLVSPILVAIIGVIAKRIVEGKPKVLTYLVHAAAHPLPASTPAPSAQSQGQAQPQAEQSAQQSNSRSVHTHSIVVKNSGKKTANNVRINHAVFPVSYQLYPAVAHTVTHGAGASAEICIPVLVPGEQITLSYLYFPPLLWSQIVGPVKCDEGMAKTIQTIPTTPPPKAVIVGFWITIFVGASTMVYWLLRLLAFVLS